MILLYLTFGVIAWIFIILAFFPKNFLKEGGWSDHEIDEVKKFFHTTNLYK